MFWAFWLLSETQRPVSYFKFLTKLQNLGLSKQLSNQITAGDTVNEKQLAQMEFWAAEGFQTTKMIRAIILLR